MFRFAIRDVLWLTVVVGLTLGWMIDHRASRTRLRNAAHFEGQLLIYGKMLQETIECLEVEGYIWGTSPNRVYLERKPQAPPKSSN